MQFTAELVARCRAQFPALSREIDGQPVAFLDGAAGSQVPQGAIDAIGDYLANCNANHEGEFATSYESDAMLENANQAAADFLGADDPRTVCFGANMTTLTLAFSRALAKTWQPGDEILVSRLDHDGNFSPWQLAARDAGVTVREVAIRPDDCTLDIDDFKSKLTDKTRLVAFCAASNFSGTINPIGDLCTLAHGA
ncbi:MAG: aminotransferase class V-fold PLP-dependent enzyme, partial [Verrucomicrobiota bacterium]|nr:aminotransferase class V-fold PLP-dependent enzyme [Verrucomicrobiota bacterium]